MTIDATKIKPGDVLPVAYGDWRSNLLVFTQNVVRAVNPLRWWKRLRHKEPILGRYHHTVVCCEPGLGVHATKKGVIHERLDSILFRYKKVIVLRRKGMDVQKFVDGVHEKVGHEYNEGHLFLHFLAEASGVESIWKLSKKSQAIICSTLAGLGYHAAGIEKINGHPWKGQDPNDIVADARKHPDRWKEIGKR
jgi:hypothetical protein